MIMNYAEFVINHQDQVANKLSELSAQGLMDDFFRLNEAQMAYTHFVSGTRPLTSSTESFVWDIWNEVKALASNVVVEVAPVKAKRTKKVK
jgi:UDP-N-acetylglucosamine transferase subunit ALG13